MLITQMEQVNSRIKTRADLALIRAAWFLVVASHFHSKCFVCPPSPQKTQTIPTLFRAFITCQRKRIGLFYSA